LSDVLITGAAGFVGRNLVDYFSARSRVILCDSREPDFDSLPGPFHRVDIRDRDQVSRVISEVSPGVVIHAAGNKNVKYCQEHPEEVHQVNAVGSGNVAYACRLAGCRMVYISTDLVFTCDTGNYNEDDDPVPTTVYGQTKLAGEKLAGQELDDLLICRSGGVYGRYSPLLKWLGGELVAGRKVECFIDIYNTPTYAANLAEMIEALLKNGLSGTFHTVGPARVNRWELFTAYAAAFGLDQELLVPAAAGEARDEMLLQPDASLDAGRITSLTGVSTDAPEAGMARLLAGGGLV
jgi:dTDP-4-dehydrorhamnose reductase